MPAGDPIRKPEEGENTDTAIYVLSRVAGEGSDRNADKGDYYLKDEEYQMLSDICAYYRDIIVIINAGAQVDLSFMDEFSNIKALLSIVQPGMEGGNAVADILSGKVNPSGKLADTFEVPVRYGFGYGLSYTEFEISDYCLKTVSAEKISISATVKNTGNVSGKEVVQVYVSLPGGTLEKEAHRLCAYAKTRELKPGEKEKVTMEISADQLTSYDKKKAAWILEGGFYGIWRGNSLASAKLCGGMKLDATATKRQVRNLFPLKQELEEIAQEISSTAKRAEAAEKLAGEQELIREVGVMIGTEMERFGVTLWLAPGMNIHRNPLCGRNFEYYSEDPYISGTIAAAMTEGVQFNYGCGTTIKHFACNNQEDNRMGSDSVVSERVLREIYLKGFEIAVKESQPMSIMTSYNLINGIHAANNYDLCTETARNKWGFKGMIMTDWTTTEHGDNCTASAA